MKFKKLIIFSLIILTILVIYQFNKDNKIYYVNLGDDLLIDGDNYSTYISKQLGDNLEEFNHDFASVKYHTTDLINDINNNTKINNKTIKNIIIKADIVTLSIGNNDLDRKVLTKEYIDEVINDIDILLKLIRTWCKEKIIVIGLNNEYANYKLKELTKEYNIDYIDIYSYSNLYKDENKINLLGHKFISHQIIDNL